MKKESPTKRPGMTLAVSHNIYLSRDDRYRLHLGEVVETQGVSTPIWYFHGRSSEPGQEVFCRYTLSNNHESDYDIDQQSDGYFINLPTEEESRIRAGMTPDEWSQLTPQGKDVIMNGVPTSEILLDSEDGGVSRMAFNQYNKTKLKGLVVHVLHFIRIADRDVLLETLA